MTRPSPAFGDTILERIAIHEGRVSIRRQQEVAPLLDLNRTLAGDGHVKNQTPSKSMRKVASIPPLVWVELKRQGIADDPAALKRWLNDPDNRLFRTTGGRV